MHKREMRNGIHKNRFLQFMWDKYGEELEFKVIEVCNREELRVREQWHIDNAKGRLLNLDLIVCELAPPEVHSSRMKKAWKNRSDKDRKELAKKISKTLKQRYKDNPEALKATREAASKARASSACKMRKTSPEANEKRRQAALKKWAEYSSDERAKRAKAVSTGMLEGMTKEQRSSIASIAAKHRIYD